jgi:hypothetical protein
MRPFALPTALRQGALACLAAVLLLAPPAGASETRHPTAGPTTDPIALALARGERYWGTVPCGGRILIASSRIAPRELEAGVADAALASGEATALMWASWERTASGEFRACAITLSAWSWPSWLWDDRHFQWFCDGITHELGHLLGHGDDGQTDPASIQYPYIAPGVPNYDSVPECRHFVLWYGHRRFSQ